MPDFVQLWFYLSSAPLVGLTATLVVCILAMALNERAGHAPWANPVPWFIVALGIGLLASGVPYPGYFAGAQCIRFLLAPAVVSLGGVAGLPVDVLRSLAPKSITAPVTQGVADKIGGVPALAALFAVLIGLVGALSGRLLFRGCGLGDARAGWMARGFAMGTASLGIGAARALQVNGRYRRLCWPGPRAAGAAGVAADTTDGAEVLTPLDACAESRGKNEENLFGIARM